MKITSHTWLAALVGTCIAGGALAADPRSAAMLANTCAGCHGTNGASAGDAMPTIGGVNKRYLYKTMKDFQSGARPSTIMGRIARGYSDLELLAIASFFAGQPWTGNQAPVDKRLAREGGKLHLEQCETCHSHGGTKNDHETPRLAGQWPDYTYHLLKDLHDIDAPGPQPIKMRQRVQKLSGDELKALSQYYAGQR